MMNQNEVDNDNVTELTDQLTDLEPIDEVLGGTKELTGTLILNSTNTYRGTTTVNQGVLN